MEITAGTEERAVAALDVLRDKLVKRHISLKAFKADDPRLSGKEYKISGTFQSGLSRENAKKIAKIIRDEGPKGVKAQVQGDELRVSSKSATTCRTSSRCSGRPGPRRGAAMNYR